jgi:hypothetical protein
MAAWVVRHMIFCPINLSQSEKDLKIVTNLFVDIATRYNNYVSEELHKGLLRADFVAKL